jgi:DNA-binding transcriptional ArsR family regulator
MQFGVTSAPGRSLGRYLEPALWVLIALDSRPLGLTALLDAVRSLDGPIGPGTLMAAVSRLEELELVELARQDSRLRVYRLTILGRVASGSTRILLGATMKTDDRGTA